jgi:hypothetical protein
MTMSQLNGLIRNVLSECRQTPDGKYRLDLAFKKLYRVLRGLDSVPRRPLSPQKNLRNRLAAALQMLPDSIVAGYAKPKMCLFGDSNCRLSNTRFVVPSEPIYFGMAYDIMTGDINKFQVVEGKHHGRRWCKVDNLSTPM